MVVTPFKELEVVELRLKKSRNELFSLVNGMVAGQQPHENHETIVIVLSKGKVSFESSVLQKSHFGAVF